MTDIIKLTDEQVEYLADKGLDWMEFLDCFEALVEAGMPPHLDLQRILATAVLGHAERTGETPRHAAIRIGGHHKFLTRLITGNGLVENYMTALREISD